MLGKLISFKKEQQDITIVFEQGIGTISILDESMVRIFSKIEENGRSKAIEGLEKKDFEYDVVRKKDSLIINTNKIIIKVFDEFRIDIYKIDGTALCKDYKGERQPRLELSEEFIQLMEQEGHEHKKEEKNHKIQVVKELEGDEYFYGLGDRTGFLNKKGYEYEMWNTDDPKPHVDSYKTLYKTIPFFITLKTNGVYGIFFDNTNRSFWDMGKESSDYYYFASDAGNLDYYFFAGESIKDIIKEYTSLTGTVNRPQLWTLGYHQSRWGYDTENEVKKLAASFREHKIPCDTIHLDIDYMEKYKVFTWNKKAFQHPKEMIEDLSKEGFKIVTIMDPGVKVEDDYQVYEEGIKNNYFVKTL